MQTTKLFLCAHFYLFLIFSCLLCLGSWRDPGIAIAHGTLIPRKANQASRTAVYDTVCTTIV